MEEFPSGQRGQTVNLLRFASVVRIHPPPPRRSKRHIVCSDFFIKSQNALILLLLLSKSQPLRWAAIWCRRFAAFFVFEERSGLTRPFRFGLVSFCSVPPLGIKLRRLIELPCLSQEDPCMQLRFGIGQTGDALWCHGLPRSHRL